MNNADILMGANLSKKYGNLEVVKDVSLNVKEGNLFPWSENPAVEKRPCSLCYRGWNGRPKDR
jgi:hypothetical protein